MDSTLASYGIVPATVTSLSQMCRGSDGAPICNRFYAVMMAGMVNELPYKIVDVTYQWHYQWRKETLPPFPLGT